MAEFNYYEIFGNVKNKGFVLYYYNTNTCDFDNYQGSFDTIEEVENKTKNDGFLKNPMYWRD